MMTPCNQTSLVIELLSGPREEDRVIGFPTKECVRETSEGWGGAVIEVAKIPKDATHIYITTI